MLFLRKESNEKVIVLRRGINCWLADWSRSTAARHVKAVMGTDVLPTAYTLKMPAAEACHRIASLNPGYAVVAVVEAKEGVRP